MATVLIVDDEPAIVEVLEYNLRRSGHAVQIARDGPSAVTSAESAPPDLVLLDIMLPGFDGYEVFRRMRARRDVPVIFLTARDDEIDRVLGLELGGDDYVAKPFSVRELMARVKAVLRRNQPAQPAARELRAGPLVLNPALQQAHWAGRVVELTAIQFALLRILAEQPGRVFDREQLLRLAWGYDAAGDTRAVDSMMKRLRARLREADGDANAIVSVRDVGYKLQV